MNIFDDWPPPQPAASINVKNYMALWLPGKAGGFRESAEQAWLGPHYVGWVDINDRIPGTFVCNWRTRMFPAKWADPYAGDSAGHVHPTREAAKAAVESKLNELRNQ